MAADSLLVLMDDDGRRQTVSDILRFLGEGHIIEGNCQDLPAGLDWDSCLRPAS